MCHFNRTNWLMRLAWPRASPVWTILKQWRRQLNLWMLSNRRAQITWFNIISSIKYSSYRNPKKITFGNTDLQQSYRRKETNPLDRQRSTFISMGRSAKIVAWFANTFRVGRHYYELWKYDATLDGLRTRQSYSTCLLIAFDSLILFDWCLNPVDTCLQFNNQLDIGLILVFECPSWNCQLGIHNPSFGFSSQICSFASRVKLEKNTCHDPEAITWIRFTQRWRHVTASELCMNNF